MIGDNRQNCRRCRTQNCYNRYFLKELKQSDLTENDLYLLTYMVLYFLDLIRSLGYTLDQAYYILSQGHESVLSMLISGKHKDIDFNQTIVDNYQGYLLSVLYYLLPNFKYKIKID